MVKSRISLKLFYKKIEHEFLRLLRFKQLYAILFVQRTGRRISTVFLSLFIFRKLWQLRLFVVLHLSMCKYSNECKYTVLESCTQFKTLELVEYVLCTLYFNTCTGSKIQEFVEYVPSITVHSTYSTNSKVLDWREKDTKW